MEAIVLVIHVVLVSVGGIEYTLEPAAIFTHPQFGEDACQVTGYALTTDIVEQARDDFGIDVSATWECVSKPVDEI